MTKSTESGGNPIAGAFRHLTAQLAAWSGIVLVLGVGVGWLTADGPGAAAGAVGAAVTLFFCGATAVVMAATMHRPVTTQSAVLVVSWIVKTLVLLGVFVWVDQTQGLNRQVLAITILVGLLGSLALDIRLVLRARIPPGT
jgi:hypothetical protein